MLNKHILLIIPARKGSTRISEKNVIDLCGQPLIAYTILAAKQSRFADRIVISTNDSKVKSIGKRFGIEIIRRPPQLARSDSKSIDAVLDVLFKLKTKGYVPDIVVLLQPTSPLRMPTDIDTAIAILMFTDADSVKSIVEIKPNPRWGLELSGKGLRYLFKDDNKKQSQELPNAFAPNGAIFAARREILVSKKTFDGDRICPMIMSDEQSIDIDDYADLKKAASYLKSRKLKS